MAETDTETFELTSEQAREVVNALTNYQYDVSGRDEQRVLNVRQLLKREFDLADEHLDEEDLGLVDWWGDVFDDDDEHDVQLSRAEAREVAAALREEETDAEPADAETMADVRERIESAFDMDATYAT